MSTNYPVDILNPEGTEVVQSGQVNFTSSTNAPYPPPTAQSITGALSTVADAPAKAVLTSIIDALVALDLATDDTT